MFEFVKSLHLNLQARFASWWRKREILAVAKALHLQDLATTPVSQHSMLYAQHAIELSAIRAGKLVVLDRRTHANTGIPITLQRINQPVAKQNPMSLRKFSRTPVVSRAINLIKAGLLGLTWDVQVIEGKANPDNSDVKARIQIAKDCINKPNNSDSYGLFTEKVLTDYLIYGMGVAEIRNNPKDDRPVMAWPFDANDIRIVPLWKEENADTMPHYAQVVPGDEQHPIYLFDHDVMTIIANAANDTPFGTGSLEIAYESVKSLLGVQRMAGVAGSTQLGRQIFWWSGSIPAQTVADMRNYLQNQLEAMGRIGMIGGAVKPEVIDVKPAADADLLPQWQEMLIRMVANAFNMSPLALGMERDVNRNTGETMNDMDFHNAVVPVAKRFAENYTRDLLHKKCQYHDLQMVYKGLEDPDTSTKIELCNARYAAGAITGNGMNEALGFPKIDSPFANLTMFEFMLLQATAASAAAPQQPMDPNGGGQPDDSGQGGDMLGIPPSGGNGANGPAVKSPAVKKPGAIGVKKPKMPSIQKPKLNSLSAGAISKMGVRMIAAYQAAGLLPPTGIGLADQMEQEQPGILDTLSDEVWEYLEKLADQELEKDGGSKPKLSKKWTQLAEKRYRKDTKLNKSLGPQSLTVQGSSRGKSQQFVKRNQRARRAVRPGVTY